jgi:mRNA-degrading endonuclease YafQ of YafQ-DinJ toxin-antitoxin module
MNMHGERIRGIKMREFSIKKAYEKDFERLMKHGTLKTNGNSSRYLIKVLTDHDFDGHLEHFRNGNTKQSVLTLNRTAKKMRKRPGWNRVRFYPVF